MLSFSLPDIPSSVSFRTCTSVRDDLRSACATSHAPSEHVVIGESEEGRPIDAFRIGQGPNAVSLIAGNHADEPVGPETLRTLVLAILDAPDTYEALLEHVTFYIVPHTNPDGEARNQAWINAWPDMGSYVKHVSRELPGRDLEFGFPRMRVENEAVADFLLPHAPFSLHASLHGMSVSEGALLLINRPWTFRTEALQQGYRQAAADAGLGMHDHNRKGEKGFFWIAPGFQTTPRGDAMRSYFQSMGDRDMADRFHSSSMEMIMDAGGDPLCIVTELPLWVLSDSSSESSDEPIEPHQPHRYNAFREQFAPLRHKDLGENAASTIRSALDGFDLQPLDLATAMRIQLRTVELALETI